VFWNHLEVVKFLVESGASLDAKNDKGRTPLEHAAAYGFKKIAEYLAEKSGKPLPPMKSKQRKTKEMGFIEGPPTPDKAKGF
jgi:ankyrin repeat protein